VISWTKPENWHVTLFFLGDTPVSRIGLLQNLLDEAFGNVNAFETALSGLGVFPNPDNPKVLWIGLKDISTLIPARNRLGALLLQNGFAFDNKPLKPHLTVGRIRKIEHPEVLNSILNDLRKFEFGKVHISNVTLFESLLTPSGPVYKPLFAKQLLIT
jgi:2'-5' RNA ligase